MSYQSVILSTSPSAYYRLGGNASDISGNSYNGVIAGGATDVAGAIHVGDDGALLLDGSTGHVTLPIGIPIGGLSAFSYAMWVKLTNTTYGQGARVIANSHTDADNLGFQLVIQSGGGGFAQIGFGSSTKDNFFSYAWQAGVWYHIGYSFSSGSIGTAIYINGSFVAGDTNVTGTIAASTHPIALGYNPAYSGDYFPGTIDEATYYNYANSSALFLEQYNAGLVMPISNPMSLVFSHKQNLNLTFQ